MKKIYLVFIVILCTLGNSYAQKNIDYIKYFLLVHSANRLTQIKQYDNALNKYKEAFKNVMYIRELDLKSALKLSKKLKDDTLKNELKNKLLNNQNNIDKSYQAEIKKLFLSDQSVRSKKYRNAQSYYRFCISDTNCNKNTVKFIKSETYLKEWRMIDSINISKLLVLMNEKGFPGEKIIGTDYAEKAFIILLHFDYDKNNLILKPYLKQALQSGQITPKNYAQIIDRREIELGESPIYYVVPLGYDKLTKEQKNKVDEMRNTIGLAPISESQKIIKKKNSIRVIYSE